MNRIDKKLLKLGFKKTEENKNVVSYQKYDKKFKFTHQVDMFENKIFSYDGSCKNGDFSNCVALSYREAKLFMKKYRQMKRKYKW